MLFLKKIIGKWFDKFLIICFNFSRVFYYLKDRALTPLRGDEGVVDNILEKYLSYRQRPIQMRCLEFY